MAFIWFELLGHGKPVDLARVLVGYTGVNLFGVWLLGSRAWFSHCELFSVFFRLVGILAPLSLRRDSASGRQRLILRYPLAGVLSERPEHISTVIFVLAMLAATAFDGLKVTQWWVNLFWKDPTGWLTHIFERPPFHALATMMPWYRAWETLWLFASPFLYFGVYILVIALTKLLTRSNRSVKTLALDFAYPLLPIVLVYHATHYFSLLLSHGLKIISLVSDPFGWRWDLFGTALKFRAPILPELGLVWHTQVGLILIGHVMSIWLAHRVALNVFDSRRQAMLSQLPMVLLMVAFTIFGLWILAQPLTAILMR